MRALSLLAVLLLLGAAQEPAPSASPAAPSPSSAPRPRGLIGAWVGSAKYQTDAKGLCRYEGVADPPSLTLELRPKGGTLKLQLPAPPGTACPPFAVDSPVSDLTLTESTASFKDAQGRQWNLALQADVLRGLMSGTDGSGELALQRRRPERRAATGGAPAAPESEGSAAAAGPNPAGEATPTAGAEPATGTAAAAPATKPGGPGLKAGTLGIIGANLIGLGALVGVNKAVQDNSAGTSTLVCSPRQCLIGGPGEPCDCTSTITTGQACGSTTSGVPVGGACALPDLPCQALLSCNNGVCEDRLGSCPF